MSENSVSNRPTVEQIEEELRRLERTRSRGRAAGLSLITLLVVAAVAVLAATLWLPVLQVTGTSMSPTLSDGDIVLASKAGNIERGDVIAFYYNDRILVKRVIGLPGEEISIDGEGNVYINGEHYEEPDILEKAPGLIDVKLPLTVAEDSYFVMGDNRAVSMDSRTTEIGTIYSGRIIGKVVLRLWPLG